MKTRLLIAILFVAASVRGATTIKTPTTYASPSSVTVNSGVTVTFKPGSNVVFTGANVSGLSGGSPTPAPQQLIIVDTVADLQNVTPAADVAVFVKGRNVIDDGGGGFFVYSNGAEQTDGGTVFAYNGDLSSTTTVSRTPANINGFTFGTPGNIAFGTFQLTLSNGIVISDLLLHGHRLDSGGVLTIPRINHKTGLFTDLNGWINYTCGLDSVTSISVSYKTIGNPRRWVRPSFDVILLPWFHGNPATDTAGAGGNRLAWALVSAKRLGKKTVDLAGNTVRYYNAIEIPDGVTLRNGTLKVIDGSGTSNVMKFLYSGYVHGADFYVGIDVGPGVFHQDGAGMIGLRNFEIDGNLAGNEDPLLNPGSYPTFGGVHNILQNTPIWCGLSVSNHSNRVVTNLRVELENVHIHHVGSAGVLGNENAWFIGRNVRIGHSFKNHQFYRADGHWNNLEMYGFCWGGMSKMRHAVIHGLRMLPEDNPYLTSDSIGMVYFEGMDYGNNAAVPAGTEPDTGIVIDGFTIDLGTVTRLNPVFSGIADGVRVVNGVVTGSKNAAATLLRHLGNGTETGIVTGWSFENISLMQRGHEWAFQNGGPGIFANSLSIKNVEIKNLRGYTNPVSSNSSQTVLKLVANVRGSGATIDPGSYLPQNIKIASFQRRNMAPTANVPVFEVDVINASAGKIKVHVLGSDISATGSAPLVNKIGTGTAAGMTLNDLTKLEIDWENSVISDNGANDFFANFELYMRCSRFRNCTTPQGYKTEESGTVTFTAAGGETTRDIQTALLWVPKNVTNVVLRAKNAATATVLAGSWISFRHRTSASDISFGLFSNSDPLKDQRNPKIRVNFPALTAGQVIDFDWSAAVAP